MIANKEEDLVKSAFSQMQNVIESYVQSSYKGAYHKKAIECIQVLRDSAIDEDEADSFNQFMIKLLERYPKENSEHSAFWDLVISCNLTLISNEENDKSGCDKKASEDWFGSLKISNTAPSTLPQELADMLNDLD